MTAIRYLTAGESHGPVLTAIIEGLPAGLEINQERIDLQLERRQGGAGRGDRMRIEKDQVQILSGVRGGRTLGSPITLRIVNRDWENWRTVMAAGLEADTRQKTITRPRPGHADLAGALKYRQQDIRNILERASARETAIRVAVGAIAQEYLRAFGIRLQGQVSAIGAVKTRLAPRIHPEKLYDTPLYCPSRKATEAMLAEIAKAQSQGNTLGGIITVVAEGLPAGLGTYVQADRRLDGRLAQALMSIQAIKGVEIGLGFKAAYLPGSKVHDEIAYHAGRGYYHKTNRAGGLEGGMTNGERLVVRAAMKPIPTLGLPLNSVDMQNKKASAAVYERSDVCAVPAAAIVAQAAVAWVLAEAISEKFAGDHLDECLSNYREYVKYLKTR